MELSFEAIKAQIVHEHLHGEIDIDRITPGQPSADTIDVISNEYDRWITSLNIPAPRVRNRRQSEFVPKNNRAMRRHLYQRVQRLYRQDRSRCANLVLSGEWRNEVETEIPIEQMESAWRAIMERVTGGRKTDITRCISFYGHVKSNFISRSQRST